MRRIAYIIICCAWATTLLAQRVSGTFVDVSMSEALRELSAQSKERAVNFLYDELEDFRVTATIKKKPLDDAIMQLIGFYPIRMDVAVNGDLFVECTHKTDRHLTGNIVDEAGLPIAYANVALLNPADSTILSGGVSNESGMFVIPYEQPQVVARVSYVGYKTVYRLCNAEVVGTIKMHPENYTIEGVVVTGERPVHRLTRGGYTTTVEGSLLAKLGNANDVLERLPRISGHDGEYTVFGCGKPVIYINGRMIASTEELKQLRSEEIRSVEVITSPGVEYDSSVNAVIRIKTIRKQGDGLSGSLSTYETLTSRLSTANYANLNYRYRDLDVFCNSWYQNNYNPFEHDNEVTIIGRQHTIDQRMQYKNAYWVQNWNVTTGMNFTVNDSNAVGVRYNWNWLPKYRMPINQHTTVLIDGNEAGTIDYDQVTHYKNGPNQELSAYYQGKAGKWSIDLNATLLWNNHGTSALSNEQSVELGSRTVTTESDINSRMQAVKLVVSRPLTEVLSIDFGTEYTNSRMEQHYDNLEGYIRATDSRIAESNIAGFATLDATVGQWTMSGGVRYEHVGSDFYADGERSSEQSRKYDQWVPSFYVAYDHRKWQHSLSLRNRISRPNYQYLSGAISYGSRWLYGSGNPNLRPSYTYQFNYNVAHKWMNMTLGYWYLKVPQANFSHFYDASSDIILATYENINDYSDLNMAISISPTIGCWNPMVELRTGMQFLDASDYGIEDNLSKPFFSVYMNHLVNLPHNWSLQGIYLFQSHYYTQFAHFMPTHELVFNVNKRLMKNNLLLKLSVFNPIKDHMLGDVDLLNPNYIQRYRRYQSPRNVQLSVSYNFNTTRNKYKGTGAGNEEKGRL